jgi:methanogenic corrinoid protein MtbC1
MMFDWNRIINESNALSELILNEMYPDTVFDSEERKAKSIKDIGWMLLFIVEGYKANNIRIVENLIVWFKKLFIGLNIEEYHAELLFDTTATVLHNRFKDISLDAFLSSVNFKDSPLNIYTPIENPYQTDLDSYVSFLLNSKRSEAQVLIHNMVQNNVSIEDIYLYIFQEAMRMIGEMWHNGEIQVGREHYSTAVTQYLMSTLYSYIINSEKKDKKLLACAVGSELHEIGIRMVADIFEINGWETNYLGPNLPYEEIIQYAKEFRPNVIALSITMPYHISILKDTISAIRDDKTLTKAKILVGGVPFLDNIELYKYVGADAVAMNAKEGVEIANQLSQ